MAVNQVPDESSGDYQLSRALQIMAVDDGTGPFRDMEEVKLHAMLATAAYTRDQAAAVRELASAMRALAAAPVGSVPASDVAQVAADIVRDILADRQKTA